MGEWFVSSALLGLLPILLIIAASGVRIVREYQRLVVFRLGKLIGVRGPGLVYIIPLIETSVRRDLRTVTLDVPPQDVITKDNVTVRVDAVVYFNVFEPILAVVAVEDFITATSKIAQTTLRSVVGQAELDELLARREEISKRIREIVDDLTDPWGIKVTIVEVKAIDLPEGMQRAMAKQAEAERERRAKIIHAEGELQASDKLAQAARIIASEPITIQLRYLQTLTEIGTEKNSTIIFPLPIDMLRLMVPDKKPA